MRARLRMVAAVLALAAAACSRDKREAERAVRAYNEATIVAYRTGDASRVKEVATDKEWGKVVVLVDLKKSNRLALESELQSFAMTDVQRASPGLMSVRTRERWRYHDRPLDPGKPLGPVFVADMALEYHLVRDDAGRWRTDSTRTISNEYLEPKGFTPSLGHGHGAGAEAGAPPTEQSR